ncbi:FAD-binding oxidoreductase [Nocardioides sp. Soil805]|uniref:FAD-binding oxidoreductase n=1 Tax=Nocardioides sp. Soil805 TaxID=1736416 RepID=UPI000703B351|nr:FAD-binding oxidoreductase [Nocardioides sp. Soil805]KRF36354.1 glycolate oxidase [Nocardioides sp. Soil805]
MATDTLAAAAREAIASACARVEDPQETDAVDGVPPGLVARPSDTEQVAEVMRACAAHGLTVVPRGRGTKLSWGTAPTSADVLLDLSALDRVLDHAAGDLIVATEAGALLADVQRTVAEGGQRLALDETVPGSTVGGVLGANTSGPRRTATGTARDLLIGITMVRADGVVAKAGGRVVKNVAGYDLGKLMIGSGGTLAVVTDATFRLHPLPAAHRWVVAPVGTPARALEVAQSVVHSQLVPAAIEVDWTGGAGSLSVLVEGRADSVAARAEVVRGLLGPDATESDSEPAGGATYPWDVSATGDDRSTALKLTCVLSGVGDVLAAADATGAVVRGSAGSGVLYAALPPGTPLDDVRTALDRLRRACTGHGGTAVVVDAPAAVKAAVDVWGPIPALDLMRRVKDQFDPDHRLSPGRFVGGI